MSQDMQKPKNSNQANYSLKLSNGFILPEGKLTPNALFVGGIDLKVDENEMREFFKRYGPVKDVKIITYRGGVCKGYGFVYFHEDVSIQSIVEQQITFKGRKLKLGPAIMKDRNCRSMTSRLGPGPWGNPAHYFFCGGCPQVAGGMVHPAHILGCGSPYHQSYHCSNFGGVMIPQMPMNYVQNLSGQQVRQSLPALYTATPPLEVSLDLPAADLRLTADPYSPHMQSPPPQWVPQQRPRTVTQGLVDCGVQTMLTVL